MGETPTSAATEGPGEPGHLRFKEVAQLLKLDVPPPRFLHELLAVLCRIAPAAGAAVMRPAEKNRMEILAAYPQPGAAGAGLDWIPRAVDASLKVAASGAPAIVAKNPVQGSSGPPPDPIVLIPVPNGTSVRAVAAFRVQPHSPQELAVCRERLEITPFLLDHYELRSALRQRQGAIDRLRLVLEVLAVANRSERFKSVCMALCNEVATRLRCQRVSLGVLDGRYVRVQAISHTDTFRREVKLTPGHRSGNGRMLRPGSGSDSSRCAERVVRQSRHHPARAASRAGRRAESAAAAQRRRVRRIDAGTPPRSALRRAARGRSRPADVRSVRSPAV